MLEARPDAHLNNRKIAAAFVETHDAAEGGHVRAAIAAKVMAHRRRRAGEEEAHLTSGGVKPSGFGALSVDVEDDAEEQKTLAQRIADSVRPRARRASWVPPTPKSSSAAFAARVDLLADHASERSCCKSKSSAADAGPAVIDPYARMPGLFEMHGKEFIFAKRACFCPCLNYNTRWRRAAVWLATWPVFEWFVIGVIVVNTLLLAVTDFTVVDRTTLDPVAYGIASAAPYAEAYS